MGTIDCGLTKNAYILLKKMSLNFQVALYKYVETEWQKTNIEGTLFVYERKCEPCYGFLILNRLSTTNLIQPITKEIELQDKTPFLLYKQKVLVKIETYTVAYKL